MTEVGVSDMAIYVPPFYLTHEDLGRARGIPPEKYQLGLGNCRMSVLPNWEDGVTMAPMRLSGFWRRRRRPLRK